MDLSQKCRRIATEVTAVFAAGIRVDSVARRFIAGMGERPSPSFFARVLTEDGDSEAESLIELLFSPDEAIQERFEALLEADCFSAAEETAILAFLRKSPLTTRLYLPGETESMEIPVPSTAISALVSRLHITQNIAPRLIAAMNSQLHPQTQLRLRVRLRNSAPAQTDPEIDCLCLFFNRIKETSPEFSAAFDFLLTFLSECPNETDYRQALIRMRNNCSDQVQRAVHFEARLAKSNMETLMLQGERPPAVGTDQLREKISRIDMLLEALFSPDG